jgi:hypothetical protein
MFFDGCVCRWSVAHFGQKPAGSPLNCIALCLLRHAALRAPAVGELRGCSQRSLLGVVWVDDFTFYRPAPWHPPCAGLAGGCATCRTALAHAEALDEWWMDLCDQLGVSLNVAKHQRCAQSVEYSGFLFDTFRGLMLVTEPKQESLLANTAELRDPDSVWTMRRLDSIKGRLLHYSAAVRHLRILVTELARLMGPVEETSYDLPRPAPPGLPELADECADVIRRFAPSGVPLWPAVPSSAYAALLAGGTVTPYFVLTWDASPSGWAALLRWRDGLGPLQEQLCVGTWPTGWDVAEQSHREALGGALGFQSALQRADLRGRVCILRNDARAAIAGFRKGSSQSPSIQRCALLLSRCAAAANVDLLPWHVPGLQLVAEGVDGASRAGDDFGPGCNVESGLGPAVSDGLWSSVLRVSAAAGWRITVDAFATESNARAPRFWSPHPEPGAEAVDALSILDWAVSRCPVCCADHRETIYAFPPLHLLRLALAKAIADRARCVLVVAVAVLAPHWNKLLAASVLPLLEFPDGFLRVRNPLPLLLHAGAYRPTELAVFACDFGRLSPRAGLPEDERCSGSRLRRPPPSCGSTADFADRSLLRERLLSLPLPHPLLPN